MLLSLHFKKIWVTWYKKKASILKLGHVSSLISLGWIYLKMTVYWYASSGQKCTFFVNEIDHIWPILSSNIFIQLLNNCLRRSKNPLHRWGKWVGVDRGFHNQKDSIYLGVQGEKHPSRPNCASSFRLKNSQQYSPHKPLLHTTT